MMNDFRFYHKDFLLGFLEIYKGMPSLWQTKHPEYHNKDKKNKDFDILIKKMKEIEPRADRKSVTNKISNLRSVYKRECKRLSKLQPYKKPHELVSDSIWYFQYLHFLQATTKLLTREATAESAAENEISEEQSQEASDTKPRKAESISNVDFIANPGDDDVSEPQAKMVKIEENDQAKDLSTEFIKETDVMMPDFIVKTEPEEPNVNVENEDDSDAVLSEIGDGTFNSDPANSDHIERTQHFVQNNFDRFDHMASAWAGILRGLPRSQQIFAEKLINDVLFEAQLESLSRQSAVIASALQKN